MYSLLQKRAHKAVEVALVKGSITRPATCDNCGADCKPHAHHDDYNKPLQVKWLCQPCHSVIHPGNRLPIRLRIIGDIEAGLIH